ncbi:MAG: ABC transporter ATP-binding protein [Candidatus Hodarchaeales archaeon]
MSEIVETSKLTDTDQEEQVIIIRLEKLTKKYGDVTAVDEIDLEIKQGEIITFLGPSGCGKTTTLRTIAGLEKADGGRIFFKNDEDITNIPPRKRDMAMVFQSYALWPHMTVFSNIEFGLTIGARKVSLHERQERVEKAARMVQVEEYLNRKPSELSGGQQQRIAVARAIVVNPAVLLLDEPFSNLDAKLRIETRSEIRSLIKDLGLTAIFVTHDQSEALAISDRIAIMNQGRIEQVGTPLEIWNNPENAFVGTFIGEANLVECIVDEIDKNSAILRLVDTQERFTSNRIKNLEKGEEAQVIFRPQVLKVSRVNVASNNQIKCRVKFSQFMGTSEHLQVVLPNGIEITVYRTLVDKPLREGENIFLEVDPDQAYAYGGIYISSFAI